MSDLVSYKKINNNLISLTHKSGKDMGVFERDVDGDYKYWPNEDNHGFMLQKI